MGVGEGGGEGGEGGGRLEVGNETGVFLEVILVVVGFFLGIDRERKNVGIPPSIYGCMMGRGIRGTRVFEARHETTPCIDTCRHARLLESTAKLLYGAQMREAHPSLFWFL